MAICSLKTELKTGLGTPQIKTQTIWTMDIGDGITESDKAGPVFATDFLGKSLDSAGNRGDLRFHWMALNDRPR